MKALLSTKRVEFDLLKAKCETVNNYFLQKECWLSFCLKWLFLNGGLDFLFKKKQTYFSLSLQKLEVTDLEGRFFSLKGKNHLRFATLTR